MFDTPWEPFLQDDIECQLGVDAAAVDIEAGTFKWKAGIGFWKIKLRAGEIHEVFGVAAIEDIEVRVKPDEVAVSSEKLGGNGVKSASCDSPNDRTLSNGWVAKCGGIKFEDDGFDAAKHFGGGAAGESKQQDTGGINTRGNLPCDAVRESRCFAGTGASNDQQR